MPAPCTLEESIIQPRCCRLGASGRTRVSILSYNDGLLVVVYVLSCSRAPPYLCSQVTKYPEPNSSTTTTPYTVQYIIVFFCVVHLRLGPAFLLSPSPSLQDAVAAPCRWPLSGPRHGAQRCPDMVGCRHWGGHGLEVDRTPALSLVSSYSMHLSTVLDPPT